MAILKIQYLKELKKNIKLKRQVKILKKMENKEDIRRDINEKINKEMTLFKKNIKKWSSHDIYKALKDIIKINPLIQGAGFAFEKNMYNGKEATTYYEEYNLYAPFVYQNQNTKKFYDYEIDYNYTLVGVPWWDTPSKTLKPYITEPYTGRMSGTNTISHAFPIIVDSVFYGVLFYDVSWQHLNFICGFA
jgi:hypothetical protein